MKLSALVAVSATALLTLSACGAASSGTANTAGGGSPQGSGSIRVATTSLGKVLVDGSGMTLYVLSADGRDHSTCSAQCLQFWPAVSPTRATRSAASTGRTTTPDGTSIATVGGRPVYTFALDAQPGDVKGEGVSEFGGTWYAASPTGAPVTTAAAPSAAPSSSGGHGYAY